jgi:hypothetical protein
LVVPVPLMNVPNSRQVPVASPAAQNEVIVITLDE